MTVRSSSPLARPAMMNCSRRTSSILERVMRAMSADCTSPSAKAGMSSERSVLSQPYSSGDVAGHRQPAQPDREEEDEQQAEQEVGDRQPEQRQDHQDLVGRGVVIPRGDDPAGTPMSDGDDDRRQTVSSSVGSTRSRMASVTGVAGRSTGRGRPAPAVRTSATSCIGSGASRPSWRSMRCTSSRVASGPAMTGRDRRAPGGSARTPPSRRPAPPESAPAAGG